MTEVQIIAAHTWEDGPIHDLLVEPFLGRLKGFVANRVELVPFLMVLHSLCFALVSLSCQTFLFLSVVLSPELGRVHQQLLHPVLLLPLGIVVRVNFFLFLDLFLIFDLLQVPLQLRLIVFSSAVLLHLCVMGFLDVADDLLLWQHAEGAGDPIFCLAGLRHQRLHQVAKLLCIHGTYIYVESLGDQYICIFT